LWRDSISFWETKDQRKPNINPKKKEEDSSLAPKCYECDLPEHMRFNCPIFKRRMEKYDKRNFKEKKAYITWKDNDKFFSDSENKIINLGLMLKDYESREEQSWYTDSGCSKHMTRDASKFIHISPKDSEYVIYGDNKQRPLNQQAQQVISNDTSRSLVFD